MRLDVQNTFSALSVVRPTTELHKRDKRAGDSVESERQYRELEIVWRVRDSIERWRGGDLLERERGDFFPETEYKRG